MTRLWVLTALLLALAIAACGADCDRSRAPQQGLQFGERGEAGGFAAPAATEG